MKRSVGIIGGGAAGMMAAIAAAKNNAEVTIIEHTDRIGKKILMTGNGKCNFTNSDMSIEKYYGNHKEFAVSVLNAFSVKDTLKFFYQNGLLYKEKNGYYYPVSNQAASVLDVLRFTIKESNVLVHTNTKVHAIEAKKAGFDVVTDKQTFHFDKLILACGGMAASMTGSDGSGYKLAKKLGHHIIKPVPALVQLRSGETYFKSISGVRVDAGVTLFINHKLACEEKGELQITDYGLSGIPIFQFSRMVSKAFDENKKTEAIVRVDCLPMYSEEELMQYLSIRN